MVDPTPVNLLRRDKQDIGLKELLLSLLRWLHEIIELEHYRSTYHRLEILHPCGTIFQEHITNLDTYFARANVYQGHTSIGLRQQRSHANLSNGRQLSHGRYQRGVKGIAQSLDEFLTHFVAQRISKNIGGFAFHCATGVPLAP